MNKLMYILGLILLDQITKTFFVTSSQFITPTINTGIAWSLFPHNNSVFIIITLVILLYLIKVFYQKQTIALTVIIAGATGNLIDRIVLGGVRDFINIKIWPIFNLADCFIVGGVILLVYHEIRRP